MNNPELLQLIEVTKRYDDAGDGGIDVIRGVSLRVGDGESVAVVGPSGCGKTTLLNIIGTLDHPSSGRVLLAGDDLAAVRGDDLADVRNRCIGFVFQSHHLLPQCTALENVLVPTLAGDRSSASKSAVERATRLLKEVGLGDRLTHRPSRLSGGERQRVAVVRALINEPRLLLADEPTGSLDGAAADEIGALLAHLNEQEGVALVVVTHSMRLAGRMGRVLELRDGRLENGRGARA